jgi:hypothetical protein
VARVSVVVLLAVAACDQGAATRLYTDDEVASIKAKASQRASRPDAVSDVSMLSLGSLVKALDEVRQEPNASMAAKRHIQLLHDARRIGEGKQTLVRMAVVQSGEVMIADALDAILRGGALHGATHGAVIYRRHSVAS